MEKLNIMYLKLLTAALVMGITSSVFAGEGFRMSSKAPVVIPPKPLRGYLFGYGGVISTSNYNTNGGFLGTAGGDPSWPGYNNGGRTNIPIVFDMNDGWSAGVGVGMYSNLLNGSRFEFEGAYDKSSLSSFTYAGSQLPASVNFTTKALMVNWLKEVPVGMATAYFGPGIGWAQTDIFGQTNGVPYNDSSDGFAWQLIAGIDIPLNERLAFFTQYRYRVLSNQTFLTAYQDFSTTTVDAPSSHSLLFGLRVSF